MDNSKQNASILFPTNMKNAQGGDCPQTRAFRNGNNPHYVPSSCLLSVGSQSIPSSWVSGMIADKVVKTSEEIHPGLFQTVTEEAENVLGAQLGRRDLIIKPFSATISKKEKLFLSKFITKEAVLCEIIKNRAGSETWVNSILKPDNYQKNKKVISSEIVTKNLDKTIDIDNIEVDLARLGIVVERLPDCIEANEITRIISEFRNLHYSLIPKEFNYDDLLSSHHEYPEMFVQSMADGTNLQWQIYHAVCKCKEFDDDLFTKLVQSKFEEDNGRFSLCCAAFNELRNLISQLECSKTLAFEHKKGKFIDEPNSKNGEQLEMLLRKVNNKVREVYLCVYYYCWMAAKQQEERYQNLTVSGLLQSMTFERLGNASLLTIANENLTSEMPQPTIVGVTPSFNNIQHSTNEHENAFDPFDFSMPNANSGNNNIWPMHPPSDYMSRERGHRFLRKERYIGS